MRTKYKYKCDRCGILRVEMHLHKGQFICSMCYKKKNLEHLKCDCGNPIEDFNILGYCGDCAHKHQNQLYSKTKVNVRRDYGTKTNRSIQRNM